LLTNSKIVHVHPTRLCNFECKHCYSSSGLQSKNSLELSKLLYTTAQLYEYGYRQISLSGGEPSVYPDLFEMCANLIEQKFAISLISNGWKPNVLEKLHDGKLVGFTAISFDGLEHNHDNIRQRSGSFCRAIESLQRLSSLGARTGAVLSVTNSSLEELPELVELLATTGVKKIQFHPIAQIGRAKTSRNSELNELSEEALARLILLSGVFSKMWPKIDFHCDAIFGSRLIKEKLIGANDTISPIVVTEQGEILPIAYGMNKKLGLGKVGFKLEKPIASDALMRIVELTKRDCSERVATTFFSELVRNSH